MDELGNPRTFYLDQNVLSNLRVGQSAREALLGLLAQIKEFDAVFVFSMPHVDECRDSGDPEAFAQVIEEIPIHFMEFQEAMDQQSLLYLGRARELLIGEGDLSQKASRVVEGLLRVLHYATGWLGDVGSQELKREMADEVRSFWKSINHDLDWGVLGGEAEGRLVRSFAQMQDEMIAQIEGFPFDQARSGWLDEWGKLRTRLPANFAQLDEVPDTAAVRFVLSCLDPCGSEVIAARFPEGFWRDCQGRKTGDLAGFSFMLALCGLVRDRRIRKGSLEGRGQHFRGQFRDGLHLENASRCSAFITFDKGAARLARSLYAYAGVYTHVIQLKLQ